MDKRTPPPCPRCDSTNVAAYIWGMPAFGEIEQDLKEGKVILGGCEVCGDEPEWRCNHCGLEFGGTGPMDDGTGLSYYAGRDPLARWDRSRHEKLADVVYGCAVGDALGVPYEFLTRDTFICTTMADGGAHHVPRGTFSDDTSMLLATCDSIKKCGDSDEREPACGATEESGATPASDTSAEGAGPDGALLSDDAANEEPAPAGTGAPDPAVNPDDMAVRFRAWLDDGAYTADGVVFDVGNTTAKALRQGHGCSDEYSNGNGSLMRTAPLAATDATDDQIRAVSAVTHAHPLSTESCVCFVHILRDVLKGKELRSAIVDNIPDDKRFEFLDEVCDWDRDEVRSTGFVLDTLGAALWCAADTSTYRDCVLAAVNLGDDSDTTAAVAGALAGALYGREAIPEEWLEDLRGKDVIKECLF